MDRTSDDSDDGVIDIPMEDFLEHFGVKGMKWGVRKDRVLREELGRPVTKGDEKWRSQHNNINTYMKLHNRMADGVDAELPGLNKKYDDRDLGYDEKTGTYKSPTGKRYLAEYESLCTKHARKAAEEVFGVSPSGNWKADARFSINNGLEVAIVPTEVSHSGVRVDGERLVFQFPVKRTPQGLFLPLGESVIKQSDIDISTEDFLEHYGVKGMKWGVRRENSTPRTPRSEDHIRSRQLKRKPVSSLSNAELKFLNERLNLEQNAARLNPNTVKKGRDTAKEIVATVGVIASVVSLARSPMGKSAIQLGKKVLWADRFNNMVSIP